MENKIETVSAEYWDDRSYKITVNSDTWYETSVTTKLGIEEKPFLLKHYADLGWDEARRQMHEAGERGKRIHFALWVYLNGGIVIYNPWQKPFYSEGQIADLKKETNGLFFDFKNQDEMLDLVKLQKFFEITKAKALDTEMTVFSKKEKIAGTLDIVIHLEKGEYDVNGSGKLLVPETGLYIADLKTGKSVSESAWAQLSAYLVAYQEMKGFSIEGALVLHTGSTIKKGIAGFASMLKTTEELKVHYEIFKSLSFVWDQRNPGFAPKVFQFPTMIRGYKKEK